MRNILIIIFILVVISASYGFLSSKDAGNKELFIGISIVGLFFVWMPLFIYHRWKNKNVKDYMLNKENIERMRKYSEDKKL